ILMTFPDSRKPFVKLFLRTEESFVFERPNHQTKRTAASPYNGLAAVRFSSLGDRPPVLPYI
ncbi:hypothetical protein, partial [Pandoraea pnomenusa]|uniref:hypothetical protein n=1 Tax=Pandoraea pnomenusa TaxID=93220 RepID=UPI00333E1B05